MTRLVIPARLIEEVEYPRIIHRPYTTEYSPLYGEQIYPAGLMKLSPLRITLCLRDESGRAIYKLSQQLWATGDTFALTLAPGTKVEVSYPQVRLMHGDITPYGFHMEFQILQVPGTKGQCPKEDDVKVYEAIIVEVDEKNEVVKVLQVVEPFAAKSTRAAQDLVMVDYAQENSLAGKDLTGIQVRVREFQATN